MVLSLFTLMEEVRVVPSAVTFNAAVTACARVGRYGQAIRFIARMQHAGCTPDVTTFSTLAHSLAKGGRMSSAMAVLDIMQGRNIEPNAATYDGLLRACIQSHTIEVGNALLASMRARGIQPRTTTFQLFRALVLVEQRSRQRECMSYRGHADTAPTAKPCNGVVPLSHVATSASRQFSSSQDATAFANIGLPSMAPTAPEPLVPLQQQPMPQQQQNLESLLQHLQVPQPPPQTTVQMQQQVQQVQLFLPQPQQHRYRHTHTQQDAIRQNRRSQHRMMWQDQRQAQHQMNQHQSFHSSELLLVASGEEDRSLPPPPAQQMMCSQQQRLQSQQNHDQQMWASHRHSCQRHYGRTTLKSQDADAACDNQLNEAAPPASWTTMPGTQLLADLLGT